MKKSEAKEHAKEIVIGMLNGRCQPEVSDVDHVASDPEDQEMIINEIYKLLSGLEDKIGK
jgi:hypothetical protein